jgi:hypothetical protein
VRTIDGRGTDHGKDGRSGRAPSTLEGVEGQGQARVPRAAFTECHREIHTPIRLAGGSDAQFRQAPSRVRPCFPPGIKSQVQPPLAPGAQIQGPQQPVQQFYVQDGGTSEVLESIVIPPKAQAPFSLLLQTEWVRTLSDGSTITLVNQRRIARDSGGRIYQERWFLVPKNGKAE